MHIISHEPTWTQHESADHAPRRWQPGEPITKNYDPAPLAALVRNATAHAAQPAPAPLPFRPHTRRPADAAADRRAA